MIFYVDGSRSSLGCQIAITDIEGSPICIEYLGENLTNIELEYEAILGACIRADENSKIFTDCEICVKQIQNTYKVKNKKFMVYLDKIRPLIKEKNIIVEWVSRDANLAGYILENKVDKAARERVSKRKNKNICNETI